VFVILGIVDEAVFAWRFIKSTANKLALRRLESGILKFINL
jgi:hypothetical protein